MSRKIFSNTVERKSDRLNRKNYRYYDSESERKARINNLLHIGDEVDTEESDNDKQGSEDNS